MSNEAPRIHSIAYDESLLRTREWILKAAGYGVTSALGFTTATAHCLNSPFDLVIIGHTIPYKDKVALVEQIRANNHLSILSLRRFGEESLRGAQEVFESSLLGPDDFLAAVRAVLEGKHDANSGGLLSKKQSTSQS